MRHRFMLPLGCLAMSAQSALAQQQAGSIDAAAMRAGFADVAGNVTKSAEMVPADKYGYRPVGTVRTFAQQIAHIADAHNYYCSRAAGRNVEWSESAEKGALDKATVLRKLKESVDACNANFAGTPPMMAGILHSTLHYGNIITYLRMMGMVPPSS